MDLSVLYLGMKLANPVVVGSGPLTRDVEGVVRCAEAGAGAVVLKSLFEEQLRHDNRDVRESMLSQAQGHSEVHEYLHADLEMQYASREYLRFIQECKRKVNIPVIASVNCTSVKFWEEFSAQTQVAGADALELNISVYPDDPTTSAGTIEDEYVDIVSLACQAVDIPIAVKLGSFFTNLPHLLSRLADAGADGFVLFNRFYPPTIDVDKVEVTMGSRHSSPEELAGPLRAIGLYEGVVPGDFSATTGVHTGEDLLRVLLAGAANAQVVTTVLANGHEQIGVLIEYLKQWMQDHRYVAIDEFRGLLSQVRNPSSDFFSRRQYMALYGRPAANQT